MIYGSISRRYAKALFDLGEEKDLLSLLIRQLGLFNTTWNENPELGHSLTSPTIPLRTRKAILQKLASKMELNEYLQRFLHLLVEKGRIESVNLIYLTLKAMADKKEGILRGEITSAFPLDTSQFDYILGSLEKKTGKKIIMTKQVNPDLIGGIFIKIEDKIIDGSVKSHLEDVQKTLAGEINP